MSEGNEREIIQAVGRLEGKVDAMNTNLANLLDRVANAEDRVRSLEKSRSWVFGAAAVCSAVFSASVYFVMTFFR